MENFFENLLSNGELQKENERLKEELESFKDDYFKGLDNKAIAELAKKSIRITAENRRLENCLKEIKAIARKEIYMKQNSSMNKIIDLITKAEEE